MGTLPSARTMAIPRTMKAAQVTAYNEPYEINEIPVPSTLGPHDVLIKVAVASHCHTDFEVAVGHWGTKLPCTGSHEGSGTVVAMGSEVKNLAVGDRVMGGMLLHPCGECYDCTGPETNRQFCQRMDGYPGVSADGFFAEYALADGRHTAKLPSGVSLIDASPLACAGRTVYRALKVTELRRGDTLAIVGCGGGLGHLAIQFAKAMGFRIIGIDIREEALEMSRKLGADVTLNAKDGDAAVIEAVKAATNGRRAESTLNLSFALSSAALACYITRLHGTVVQVSEPAVVEIPPDELVFRDIRIRSTLISSGDESREMLQFVAKHGITVSTTLFNGIESILELTEWAKNNKSLGKGCLVIDRDQI